MSPSLTSVPFSSVDAHRLHVGSDPSKQSAVHIATTPVDDSLLSAYPPYQTHSNSASPSTFSTPAELTSENSGFSEYDFAGDDEFFGVDFDDTGDQSIDLHPLILEGPLSTTELPEVEAYLPQLPNDTAQSSETATNSTYPMSSNQSSPPSRHSPKSGAHESNLTLMAPHYELTTSSPALQAAMAYDNPTVMRGMEDAPDTSGTNNYNGDNGGLSMAAHMNHSPRVTITPWGSLEQQEIRQDMDQQDTEYGGHLSTWHDGIQDPMTSGHQPADAHTWQPLSVSAHQTVENGDQDGENAEGSNGRAGVDPERRKSLSNMEIPNLKDQDEYHRLRLKNMEVEEWRSQAGDSSDTVDETPGQSQPTLSAPNFNSRRRASSTSAIPGYFGAIELTGPPKVPLDPEEGQDIDPVSDSESIRENQLKDGQTYFNPNATTINDGDRSLIQQMRHWSDTPAYAYVMNTTTQAPTANEAVMKWNQRADNFSLLSRQATWGTRRQSEPSIADMESINSGSFLKRLSFSNRKEKRPGPGGLFKDSLDQFTSIVRMKSDSKLKRSRSDRDGRGRSEARSPTIKKEGHTSLALPHESLGAGRRSPSPRLNTNVGASPTPSVPHARSGSASATAASPPKALGFMNSVIRRARSRSDLQQDTAKVGLVGLWRESGGPPVPTLASQPVENEPKLEYSDAEGDEDDDDEPADDGEMMDFDQATPITPNFLGFQEHVLRLYPTMEPSYLVDRIAHQQVVRYKTLLGWRVKHSGSIANGNCPAGSHCIALGGSPTVLESKNQPRDNDASMSGLQAMPDISDGESNPEGALVAESFPQGVPMPPAQTLPAEFECQLCFRVKKFQKPSDWTKHVHEDVQPFTCTYPSCKEPKSFKRKADWVRHENERHRRLSWWTCTVDDCTHKCYRKDNFLQHLVREHKIPEPKLKSKAAAKKARSSDEPIWVMIRNCHHETTNRPQDEPCKFCGKVLTTWKKLTVHLAKHMEGISLSVLRLVEQREVDANTIISPVEALPIRQVQLTPVERTDRPSTGSGRFGNMSASISPSGQSPNVQSMPHFSSPMYPQASPNVQDIPQFTGVMYGQNMGFAPATTDQDMSSYNVQAPIPHHQTGIMYDNNGMPYSAIDQIGPPTQSRGFTPMDHSPHLDQSRGFTTVDGNYTTPITQQQGYRSYPSSNQTLSPDPSYVSGPQQMPGFQPQPRAMGQNQHPYASSPQHGPGHQPQQLLDLADEDFYKYQGLGGPNNGLAYDQMIMMRGQDQISMMSDQGGVPYPPTSTGGYSYHGQ